MAYFDFTQIDNSKAEPELIRCSGNISDYDFTEFSGKAFQERVQQHNGIPVRTLEGIRAENSESVHSSTDGISFVRNSNVSGTSSIAGAGVADGAADIGSNRSAGAGSSGCTPQAPQTLDELYAVCTQNPPDTKLTESLRIRELWCSRQTADFYTSKYDGEGFHLMELRYYDCDPESDLIFFKFPYTEKRQFACTFNARIFINNPLTYNRILPRIYQYDGPILVYGEWELAGDLMASIDSDAQVVRL